MHPIDPSPVTAIPLPSLTTPATLAPLTPEPTPQPEHDTSDWAALIKNTPTHKADVKLAGAYAAALSVAARNTPWRFGGQAVSPIPADSMFGQWRAHLDSLIAAPDFQQWAKANGIDLSRPLHIYPAQGAIPAYLSAFPIPSATNSPNTKKQVRKPDYNSGLPSLPASWPLIMRAAGTLAPGKASVEVAAPGRSSPGLHAERTARLEDLRAFYGEAWPETQEAVTQRVNELKQADAFPLPDSALSNEQLQMRAEEVIEHQQKELGDIHNRHQLSQLLSAALASPTDANAAEPRAPTYASIPRSPEEMEKRAIAQALENTSIKVDPSSWYFQDAQLEPGEIVSLKQFITDHEWEVPQTPEEVINLIKFLNAGHLPTVPHGNLTGAAGWTAPLSDDEKNRLYSNVRYNNLKIPALDTAAEDIRQGGAFRYLTKNRYWTDWEISSNPRQVLQEILESSKAKELEAALHKAMGNIDGAGDSDWVLGAMVLGLADQGWRYGTERNKVGNFDLADKAFYGKPLEDIRHEFSEYLIRKNRTTRSMAPVARHLLLASAAPELLVKNIPASVTYGSPDWFNLKTTVAFIEAKNPGSSSLMSFADVITYGAIDPLNNEDQALLNEVTQDTLVDWALIHGILTPSPTGVYSDEQLSSARTAFSKVMEGLTRIRNDLNENLPLQKDMALDKLGKHFSNIDLEAPVITNSHARTATALNSTWLDVNRGPYSLLDLYLSDHHSGLKKGNNWYSLDQDKVPAETIKLLGNIGEIKKEHRAAIENHFSAKRSALTNLTTHLMAQLPLEDRRQLEYGKLEIFEEGTVTKKIISHPRGQLIDDPRFIEQKPDRKSLIIKTTLAGVEKIYEFSPQQNTIKPVPSIKPGLQGDWINGGSDAAGTLLRNTSIAEFKLSAGLENQLHASVPSEGAVPATYTSSRSQFIGALLAGHVLGKPNVDDITNATSHTHRFTEEDEEAEHNKEVLLGSLVVVNPIRNVIKGDWEAVMADLLFDGIMFLTTAGLGKSLSALKSLRTITRIGGKLIRKRVFNRTLTHSLPGSTSRLNGLRGRARQYDLSKYATDPDIAQGTYKSGNTTLSTPAKLDKKTGAWHAFEPTTNRHYGKPLENFTPHTITDTAVPGTSQRAHSSQQRLLDLSLGRDNVVQMGGPMQDLKLIGKEIHTYTDFYKNTHRLNIVAHGYERDFFDKLTGNGTRVVIDNINYDAKGLVALLRSKGVDPATFDNVRLLICHAAEGKSKAFARLFKQEIGGKPVKAFEGTVTMTHGSTGMTRARGDALSEVKQNYPKAEPSAVEILTDQMMRRAYVGKVTPEVVKNHGQTIRVNIAPPSKPPVYKTKTINYQPRQFRR